MYEYLTGRVAVRKPTHAVLDVGGVGYRVEIPLSTFEKLPATGTATLHTVFKVSEDAHRLFGFATEREREVFVRLVDGVSGLGPSKALAILSNIGIAEFLKAVEAADVALLKRVKGIGDKLANRLVVELKGRLPDEAAGKEGPTASLDRDAVQALVALGYDRTTSDQAVRAARKDLGPAARVEDVIKRSLANV